MRVEYFIDEINSVFPSFEQVKSKYEAIIPGFDSQKMSEYEKRRVLRIEGDSYQGDNPIDYLIYNTNIVSAGIGSIGFSIEVVLMEEVYMEFAMYNDFYGVCYLRDNQDKLVFVDYESDQEYGLSSTVEDFLVFLIQYDRYHKHIFYGTEYSPSTVKNILEGLVNNGFSRDWINMLMPDAFQAD